MIKLIEKINLSGSTLIIPVVAIGNVGQLAVDLLISSLKMKRVGHLFNSCFIPILGADPYNKDSNELCTMCDIYYEDKHKIVALQIRSPPVKNLKSFFHELKEFIKEQKIAKVIVLTSGWAHTRTDVQLRSEPMRYLSSPEINKDFSKKFQDSNWLKLESSDSPDGSQSFRIPGGGFAMKIFNYFTENKIPSLVVLRFCSEGDNVPDAVALINYLDRFLSFGLTDSKGSINVIYPHSWDFLFGNPAPLDIY